jgi:non-ribosomal peptide synthetase component F
MRNRTCEQRNPSGSRGTASEDGEISYRGSILPITHFGTGGYLGCSCLRAYGMTEATHQMPRTSPALQRPSKRRVQEHGELQETATTTLTDSERQRVCGKWNDTTRAYPQRSVHELFELHAAQRSEAVAVIDEETRLTYGELNRRANRLAHRLRAHGVGRDVPVGVCIHRTSAMIVAWLGILKAGGAYVPLDPADPPSRLAFLAADTGLRIVVT